MARIKIVNWGRWQSYRSDRGQPPWIKVHRILLRNPEWLDLTDAQRGQLVSMWMLAADNDGVIVTPERRQGDAKIEHVSSYLRKVLYLTEDVELQALIDLRFIEEWRQPDAKVTPTRRQGDAPEKSRREKNRGEESRGEKKKTRARTNGTARAVLAHWNTFEALTRHRALSGKTTASINARVKAGYSESDLCRAITRYSELCQERKAAGHNTWGLYELMSRGEGSWIDKMLDPNYEGIVHETADDRRRKHNAEVLRTHRQVSVSDGRDSQEGSVPGDALDIRRGTL